MKTASKLETQLNALFTKTFPAQLPQWFSQIIAAWTWLIVPAVIIVQPLIGWGYWDDAHTNTTSPNFFFYVTFIVMGLEMLLQLLALSGLRTLQRSSWQLLYYSAFCIPLYGMVRIFSTEGSIGPLCGMLLLAAIFFYLLFQIRPCFTKTRHQRS